MLTFINIATYATSVAWVSQTKPAYSLGGSQAHDHGLWPVAIQPHIAMDYHSFTGPVGMEG